jgi:LCP family protein required for cell wall assembly
MPDETTPTPAPPTPAPATRRRRRTVLRVVLASALVLALASGVGTWLFVRHLDGNIETGSLDDLGPGRPERQYTGNGKPLNILVMGDDSRDGEGNRIDSEEGAGRSDTTILVHLSADRSRAYAVSIPRDSIVDRPACNDGESPAENRVMWNEAFTIGDEFCTADQFEQMTDIVLDHYVVVDFYGFGQMVEAVDGVPVCVPYDIVDEDNAIFVPKGDPSILTGDEALDYFRARYVGDKIEQNDISRIRRQQEFIGALVRKLQSAGTLARPDRVIRFLDAATKSLRTDDDLGSVTKIARIALQLQDIGLDKVQFVTLPTEYYALGSDLEGKVYWTPDAFQIWDLLNHDEVLPASLIGDTSVDAEGPGGGGGKGSGGSGSGGSSGGGSADEPVYGICG